MVHISRNFVNENVKFRQSINQDVHTYIQMKIIQLNADENSSVIWGNSKILARKAPQSANGRTGTQREAWSQLPPWPCPTPFQAKSTLRQLSSAQQPLLSSSSLHCFGPYLRFPRPHQCLREHDRAVVSNSRAAMAKSKENMWWQVEYT